jgi:hypothetical protein
MLQKVVRTVTIVLVECLMLQQVVRTVTIVLLESLFS